MEPVRLKAFALGLLLVLSVPAASVFILGPDSRLSIPLSAVAYGVAAAVFGFFHPGGGWRSGLWLVACWFALLFLSALFAADNIVWNAKRDVQGLAGHLLILAAACLGAEAGAIIGRKRRAGPVASG